MPEGVGYKPANKLDVDGKLSRMVSYTRKKPKRPKPDPRKSGSRDAVRG